MWQAGQSLAQQAVDLLRREFIGQLLHQLRVRARQDAVIQRLRVNTPLGELTLEILMTVDAQFGVIREVLEELEELDEKRAEVCVYHVAKVMVDHRGRVGQPRVVVTAVWILPALGAQHAGFLLSLTDNSTPSLPDHSRRYACVRSAVFAAPKPDHIKRLLLGIALNGADKARSRTFSLGT